MYFHCPKLLLFLAAVLPTFAQTRVLRVCADPNNLPFSNEKQEGVENKLADLLAEDMSARVQYTWWSQRKSFASKSLNADACDVILGVPTSLPDVTNTEAYYRSTYVFLTRRTSDLQLTSLMDPRLQHLRIGVHVVGDDYAPPAFALAEQGITRNVEGFSLFAAYGEISAPRKLVDAVAAGTVDVAIIWGPFAGYFAKQEAVLLDIAPVSPPMYRGVPFTYEIGAAVRLGNLTLKEEIDKGLQAHATAIRRLLDAYGIPQAQ